MKDPYFITAERLEEVLELEFGLHHRANRSTSWTLTDLLQQSYLISTIHKVYNGLQTPLNLVVPIDGVTAGTTDKGRQLLRIPDSNLKHIRSMFIDSADTWIIWLQSKQQPERCWAWEIDVEPPGQIQPLNPVFRAEGWHIAPCTELTAHITQWYSRLYIDSMAAQHTRFCNTARMLHRQLSLLDPALLAQQSELTAIQDDIMNKMIAGKQTN